MRLFKEQGFPQNRFYSRFESRIHSENEGVKRILKPITSLSDDFMRFL